MLLLSDTFNGRLLSSISSVIVSSCKILLFLLLASVSFFVHLQISTTTMMIKMMPPIDRPRIKPKLDLDSGAGVGGEGGR